MHKYSKYIKWLLMLTVVFISCTLFAANDYPSSPLWDMFKDLSFTPPRTDLSVGYLAKLFGSVPGIQQFAMSGTSILGPIFAVFNGGILAISGCFLSYTIFKIVTETTMDGSTMGKNTTIWTSIRVALTTSLLVPQPTGYSLVNGIVMWVVIQSIGLADMTWANAMRYLQHSKPVVATTKSDTVDYGLVEGALSTASDDNKNVGSADVLTSLICSYAVKNTLDTYQDVNKVNIGYNYPNALKDRFTESSKFNIYKDADPGMQTGKIYSGYDGGVIYFPYIENEQMNAGGKILSPYMDYGIPVTKFLKGACGAIGYALEGVKATEYIESSNKGNANRALLVAKKQALLDMIGTLDPIAKQLVNKFKLTDGKRALDPITYTLYIDNKGQKQGLLIDPAKGIDPANFIGKDFMANPAKVPAGLNWPMGTQEMLSSAVNYQLAMGTAKQDYTTIVGGTQQAIEAEYNAIINDGWVMAGSYYQKLKQISQQIAADKNQYKLLKYGADGNPSTRTPALFPYFEFDSTFDDSLLTNFFNTLNGDNSLTSGDAETLSRGVQWVYMTFWFTKVLGDYINPSTISSNLGHVNQNLIRDTESDITGRMKKNAVLLGVPIFGAYALTILATIPTEYLQLYVERIMKSWNTNMVDQGDLDPIVKLRNLGEVMMGESFNYLDRIQDYILWTSMSMAISTAAANILGIVTAPGGYWGIAQGYATLANTLVSALESVNELARTILYINLPLGLAVVGPLFVTGATLSIYVPLIPYLLFLFGTISWLISVIVLMAAAPIICFLMLWGSPSQENPLLAKEAEQFVMQMVAVFFRPTLMVIGLIVGILLSYIAVNILNAGFNRVFNLTGIFSGNNQMEQYPGRTALVKQVAFAIIYTFTMVSIINMCFSTIYLLYSEALRIAGIQVAATGMEEKHLGEVKAEATKYAEAGISGMKESATAMKGAAVSSKVGHIKSKKKSKTTPTAEQKNPQPPAEEEEEE